MILSQHRVAACQTVACLFAVTMLAASATAEGLSYSSDIRPILAENCFQCHGPDARARKGDLRLDDAESARGVLKATDSELVRRITTTDPDDQMPPAESNKHLPPTQQALLAQWVEEGAPYEAHWAYTPPVRPEVPPAQAGGWARNSIDHFVLRRAALEGLTPSTATDRANLIRRVSLDLVGLPPTPAEVTAFERDSSPQAFKKVVDRLLRSDRYGEHMAQGWLEVARYADTDGYQNDRLRNMHVWKEWLIGALNENLPFDQFVIEQMAGDMLPDATLRQQIATGFNRNHRINSENGAIPSEWLVENVADRVETLGTAFLGLTLMCARCHDHKYDPITQREYFRLFAQFNNVPEWGLGPNDGNSPPYITVPKNWPHLAPEQDRLIEPVPYKLKIIKGTALRPVPGEIDSVMVMQELATPRPTYRLNRGVYSEPDKSEVLSASVPAILLGAGERPPANRLELARWLIDPAHPLTARVTVNRFWQHFFGRGIVATQENFGLQGANPSHPELLDWLATELIRMDWNVKAFQKMVVMSATYRQSSDVTAVALEKDPENIFLARAPRLRLTGQQLRDQALAVSGLLVNKIGGAPTRPYMPPGIWSSMANMTYEQGEGDDLYRRSIYTYWRRTTPPPMMTGFNSPNRDTCVVRSEKTNSPLHALSLMNNVTFVESARILAEQMLAEGSTERDRIASGFRRVTARVPTASELDALTAVCGNLKLQFSKDQKGARALLKTGERPANAGIDITELASMTMVASAILNLDEVVVRN
jgi:hypothetical protein